MNPSDWDYESTCWHGNRAVRGLPNQKGKGARCVSPFQGEILFSSKNKESLFSSRNKVGDFQSLAHPIQSYSWVFADIETTGGGSYQSGNRIVSLAVCRKKPCGEIKGPYEQVLHPGVPIKWYTSKIHGFYEHHIRNKPRFKKIASKLASFCQGSVLIAHNGRLCDGPLLQGSFSDAGVSYPFLCLVDTLPLVRRVWPKSYTHKLVPLSKSLGLSCGEAHSATGDVQTLMNLFFKMLTVLPKEISLLDLLRNNISKENTLHWNRKEKHGDSLLPYTQTYL